MYSRLLFLGRPIVCFAYDYLAYREHRGLYLDLNVAMPSGVKHTEQEVIAQIKNMDYAAEEAEAERND